MTEKRKIDIPLNDTHLIRVERSAFPSKWKKGLMKGIDIRKWYRMEGESEWQPSKTKGIWINITYAKDILSAFQTLMEGISAWADEEPPQDKPKPPQEDENQEELNKLLDNIGAEETPF